MSYGQKDLEMQERIVSTLLCILLELFPYFLKLSNNGIGQNQNQK